MAGNALFALTALILGAMPPAMPDQVPELMHRAILPVTVDAPTCIAVADRPVGETDQLLVGLANGTINVFHASGSKMIVRIFEFESGHAIDDLCAVRLPGTGINFAFLARQGRTLSVMGEETSQVRGRLSLPLPNGRYEFTRVAAKLEKRGSSGHSHERVLLHDDLNVFEITLDAVGQRWRMTLVPVVSDCNGVVVHELSDRAIIVTGSHFILDFTAEEGAAEPVRLAQPAATQ